MIVAECYFLDVGQASAHVIDLGDGSAVVIDCGGPSDVAITLLDRLGVKRIAAIALTHNHVDHSGGIRRIVEQYRRQIGHVAFLQDETARKLMQRRVLSFLFEEAKQKNIPRPVCLQKSEDSSCLYQRADLRVEILYPDFMENIEAQTQGDQNACSAVLLLQCGSRKIVFPGDAKLSVWQAIRDKRNVPLRCDVLAVPHHGGQIVRNRRRGESDGDFYKAIRPDYDRLYTDCIRPEYAIVSAGSGNSHDHPIPVHLDALRDAGAKVLCTQITERCHSNVSELAPAVLEAKPGQDSLPGHAKGSNPAVACAGTVLVQIGPDKITVDRFDDHRQEVRRKVSAPDGNPRCL